MCFYFTQTLNREGTYHIAMLPFNLTKEQLYKEKNPKELWIKEATTINDQIQSLYGPNGLYKMTRDGEILTTGKEIIDTIDLGPLADPIRKSINAQYTEHTDGTTSLSLLLARSVKNAQKLQTKHGLKKQTIIEGYTKATTIALETVKEYTKKVEKDDVETLNNIIKQSTAGTIADKENIQSCIRDAILYLKKPKEKDINVSADESGEGAEVFVGVHLDYNRVRDDMPEEIQDAIIALVTEIKPKKPSFDTLITIDDIATYKATANFEKEQLQRYVNRLIKLNVKAVFSKGDIDDRAAQMLTKQGIMSFEKIKEKDLQTIQEATGASLRPILSLDEEDIGLAGIIDDSDSEECVGGVCRT